MPALVLRLYKDELIHYSGDEYYRFLYFIAEETEAQRGEATEPKSDN